jgi:hypothetical protein
MTEREEREPDFQLTGDDPMMEQIEAATRTPASSGDPAGDGSWSLPSYSVPPTGGEGGGDAQGEAQAQGEAGEAQAEGEAQGLGGAQALGGPLEPGEPAWMQHEPDASQ